MITKLGMAALLGTMGTAAMAAPASAHEGVPVEQVRYERDLGYGYGGYYGGRRDFAHERWERNHAWRERMRWMRFHHGRGRWGYDYDRF